MFHSSSVCPSLDIQISSTFIFLVVFVSKTSFGLHPLNLSPFATPPSPFLVSKSPRGNVLPTERGEQKRQFVAQVSLVFPIPASAPPERNKVKGCRRGFDRSMRDNGQVRAKFVASLDEVQSRGPGGIVAVLLIHPTTSFFAGLSSNIPPGTEQVGRKNIRTFRV